MNCQYCGKEIKQELTGRQKRYCSDAHKQAAFRRRHPEKSLRNDLRVARRRILELERFAKQHAPGYRLAREIAPISLEEMLQAHGGIARLHINNAIEIGLLKPVDGILDADGQEHFYQLGNGQQGWRTCPNCPHGVIP